MCFCTSKKGVSGTDCQAASALTTCFHKEMIGRVLCEVSVACNSLKTMTTDKIYQCIDYYCMLIYTQSLIWPATRPNYLLNFGSKKIGPRTTILALCIYYILYYNDKTSQR